MVQRRGRRDAPLPPGAAAPRRGGGEQNRQERPRLAERAHARPPPGSPLQLLALLAPVHALLQHRDLFRHRAHLLLHRDDVRRVRRRRVRRRRTRLPGGRRQVREPTPERGAVREGLLERSAELRALHRALNLRVEPRLARGEAEPGPGTRAVVRRVVRPRGRGRGGAALSRGRERALRGVFDAVHPPRRVRLRRRLERPELLPRRRRLLGLAPEHGGLAVHRALRLLRLERVAPAFLARRLRRALRLALLGDALLRRALDAPDEVDARGAEALDVRAERLRGELALLPPPRRLSVRRRQTTHLLEAALELRQPPAVLRLHLPANRIVLFRRARELRHEVVALRRELRLLRVQRREEPTVLLANRLDVGGVRGGARARRVRLARRRRRRRLLAKRRARLRGSRRHRRLLRAERALHRGELRPQLVPRGVLVEIERGFVLVLGERVLVFERRAGVGVVRVVVRRGGVLRPRVRAALLRRRELLLQPALLVSERLDRAQVAPNHPSA